ncbi:DNA repair protein RAD16 [Podospora fimiseda]|uniref:DNA repair protein RAD16 n=1 Tax=Podospora fimiseda TaxID=252190 RepID=A0AAN7GZ38_9PEZI|nr:DNA repair protein RAD16 [Podospora fimiseda]
MGRVGGGWLMLDKSIKAGHVRSRLTNANLSFSSFPPGTADDLSSDELQRQEGGNKFLIFFFALLTSIVLNFLKQFTRLYWVPPSPNITPAFSSLFNQILSTPLLRAFGLEVEAEAAICRANCHLFTTILDNDIGTFKMVRTRSSTAANGLSSIDSSTALTPSTYTSGSEYSTPLTSNVATPAPEISQPSSKKRLNRIEVQLPAAKKSTQANSIYAMTSSKRKRVVEDSEDEDFSDNSASAKLARKLQAEEDDAAAKSGTVRAMVASSQIAQASRLSKPAPSPSSRPGKKRAIVVPDSEDSSELSDVYFPSDDEEFQPKLSKSKPTASNVASRTAPAALADDESIPPEDDDSIRVADLSGSDSELSDPPDLDDHEDEDGDGAGSSTVTASAVRQATNNRRAYRAYASTRRARKDRNRLENQHPQLKTMWVDLENMPVLKAGRAEQPKSISRQLKPFQLEGLAWMKAMEKTEWKGGLLGDEMGLGKTIQAVSLIMSDFPADKPSLVLVPPVALMQWMTEIQSYTDGTLKTLVFHGTNAKSKNLTVRDIKKYDVIIMSYNSLESLYRKQEKGFNRKDGLYKENSVIHKTEFHRVILDEAHCIKTRTTMTAKACFALKVTYRWCLTGTPLQNRIGEFFSLIRFLNIQPFSCYLCKMCPCSTLEWSMNDDNRCTSCNHGGMQHVSVFNQELLNPIQRYGNRGPGTEALRKLRIMTDRIMLRRVKKDHTDSMELPVKEINVERQFFGEEENDFANSIMTNGQRKFDTYVATGVLLNNYANIFGLIMQMRQVADHPDLILKKNSEGGQNILVCGICDEPAEDAIRSRCKHDFCRTCVKSYLHSTTEPNCPQCHIPLSIDLEQPEMEQDEALVKKSSIINRIKMENWTSSSKIELLVHELHRLRSDNASHKSIIFSQFTTMLQLIEWRLRRAGITTVMLDGSMTPAQRQASIEHFMNNVDVECFLVSLKAGGVALNLTEASHVFIVDPWWNPAAEWQSADRCHRIGQTRPCTITRLCIEDSVESRMVLLQEKKTNMINSTINSDDAAMDSLSPEDLQFLFRGS